MAGFRHSIRVRYGEVDLQRVVFNAHYMAYCDDAVEAWFEAAGIDTLAIGWDFMLKKAVLEWRSGASLREILDLDLGVVRWGNTSFDVGVVGAVGDRPVFSAVLTYVGVDSVTISPSTVPEDVRSRLTSSSAAA